MKCEEHVADVGTLYWDGEDLVGVCDNCGIDVFTSIAAIVEYFHWEPMPE